MKKALKIILTLVGILSVALGVVGMFVPLLPTTPFLLLAAVCFSKSSERMHRWLLGNRWFGRYIRDYREGRGVPLRAKILALLTLWASMIYLVAFRVPLVPVKALLLAVAVAVSVHLVRLKTAAPPSAIASDNCTADPRRA